MLSQTLHLCLHHFVYLPVELRRIIQQFSFEYITNENIRKAVFMTLTEKGTIQFGPMEFWDTSDVTDMSFVFMHNTIDQYRPFYRYFNLDISRWDTSNVTDMKGMFYDCSDFNQPIENWNVSNVRDFTGMFYEAHDFNQPIGKWKVRNATMNYMFNFASSFNQPLTDWELPDTGTLEWMFVGAMSFKQPLPSFVL